MITEWQTINLVLLDLIEVKNTEFIKEADFWWERLGHNCDYADYIKSYLAVRWDSMALCN